MLIFFNPLPMIPARTRRAARHPFGPKNGTVQNMVITKVRASTIEAAFPQPLAYLRTWYDRRTAIIVEIETDKGLIGRGGCHGPVEPAANAIATMTPWLVGENPLCPTLLRQSIYARLDGCRRAGIREALTGIYAALWDIKDKQQLLSNAPAAWSAHFAKEAQHLPLPAERFEQKLPNPAMMEVPPRPGRGTHLHDAKVEIAF